MDPRPAAVGELAKAFARHPHIGAVLPALGSNPAQLEALAATLRRVPADVVVAATPVDLARLIAVDKPIVRARYEFAEPGEPHLALRIDAWLATLAQHLTRFAEPPIERGSKVLAGSPRTTAR